MNKKQIIVLWAGALIIAGMALYPPWKYVCRKYSIEKIAPYAFVFSPPEITLIASGNDDMSAKIMEASALIRAGVDFGICPQDMRAVQVDWYRLGLPAIAAGLLTVALTLTFRVGGSAKD